MTNLEFSKIVVGNRYTSWMAIKSLESQLSSDAKPIAWVSPVPSKVRPMGIVGVWGEDTIAPTYEWSKSQLRKVEPDGATVASLSGMVEFRNWQSDLLFSNRVQLFAQNNVQVLEFEADGACKITLANGEILKAPELIWVGRLEECTFLEDSAVEIERRFFRGRESYIQVVFSHQVSEWFQKQMTTKCFYRLSLQREPYEERSKIVEGYFDPELFQSVWNIPFDLDEAETNEEISKRIRRLKQALDKIWPEYFLKSIEKQSFGLEERASGAAQGLWRHPSGNAIFLNDAHAGWTLPENDRSVDLPATSPEQVTPVSER